MCAIYFPQLPLGLFFFCFFVFCFCGFFCWFFFGPPCTFGFCHDLLYSVKVVLGKLKYLVSLAGVICWCFLASFCWHATLCKFVQALHMYRNKETRETFFLRQIIYSIAVADLRGGARDARPPWPKISSFSCSFREKLTK